MPQQQNNHHQDNILSNRNLYVGASDLSAIFNISKYKTQFELAKEKILDCTSSETSNEYAKYGQLMEPKIREYVNNDLYINFVEDSKTIEELKIRGNVDGIDRENNIMLEIKTNKGELTQSELEPYLLQIQLYLYIYNLDVCILAQYKRPENFYKGTLFELENGEEHFNLDFDPRNLTMTNIHRDEAKIKEILSQIKLFWKRVEMLRTTNKAMLEVDYYLLESTELEKDNLYLTLSQIEQLEEKLLENKQIEQQLKKEKEELFKILDVIGMKKLETTKLTITKVDATTMTTIDSAKLKEEKPNVYAKYSKISNKKGYVKVTLKDKNKQNTVAIVKESKSDMLADLGL